MLIVVLDTGVQQHAFTQLEKMMENEELGKLYAKIVVKAWKDDAFKAKLIADPIATLKSEGIDLPSGAKVSVQDESTEWVLPIPKRPEPALGGTDPDDDAALGYSSSTLCCTH